MRQFIYKSFITLSFFFIYLIGIYGQSVIQLEKDGGVFKVPCVVNGLKLKLIFDTGASNVCISQSVALMMLENDYLSANDIKGTAQSQVADGRIVDHTKINLRKIQIGDKVLTNVEAVVIHGQTAPLLLGQSALKRLGRYSISGDKLILGINIITSQKNNNLDLSESEIDALFQEADNSYDEAAYSVAIEKYRILDNHDLLSALGKMQYADCYYYLDKKEEALQLYYDIQEEIELDFPQYKESLYYQIGRCLWSLEDIDAAIPYFEKVKYLAKPWSSLQSSAVGILSSIYYEKDDGYRSRRILEDYINQYLAFMEIKSTDCWDKLYIDEFLSNLYYCRYLSSSSNEYEKFIIIAAAWGNKKAIEYCKEHKIDYSSKPYKYEY